MISYKEDQMPKPSRIPTSTDSWTFIELTRDARDRIKWLCQCICGNKKALSPEKVVQGSRCSDCYRSRQIVPMIGKKFGELTVISFSHSKLDCRFYVCSCSCGNKRVCKGSHLREGRAKFCLSCTKSKQGKWLITHGKTNTSTYYIWRGMHARCGNPNIYNYKNYGGRGITVCERWAIFEAFLQDMGDRPEGMQIDRIDNDKGYFKDNCRWVTPRENCNNRRRRNSLKEGSGESKSTVLVTMNPIPNSPLVPERKTDE